VGCNEPRATTSLQTIDGLGELIKGDGDGQATAGSGLAEPDDKGKMGGNDSRAAKCLPNVNGISSATAAENWSMRKGSSSLPLESMKKQSVRSYQ